MFRKKQLLSDLKPGAFVDDVFVVKIKRELRPYQNGFRFTLILSDASGRSVEYVYWGDHDETAVRRIFDSIQDDSVIHIQATHGSYRGKPQLSSQPGDMVTVLSPGEYEPMDFIQPARRPIDDMLKELDHHIASVKNPDLHSLLTSVFTDPHIRDKLRIHPAAVEIHHNRLGGFLEHILETTSLCKLCIKFYELDHDLTITGALLHDIGKLDELSISTRIKATRDGQLLGHITQGALYLNQKMNTLKTPALLREKLLHIVIAHHGHLEYGSPKTPMFPEAMAVHFADATSAKVDELKTFIDSVKGNIEGDFVYYKRGNLNLLVK
ncbi:MAG TPA: HD domain-containing protein [archaeon]|nr:HD domain-containing protein [archaeon]